MVQPISRNRNIIKLIKWNLRTQPIPSHEVHHSSFTYSKSIKNKSPPTIQPHDHDPRSTNSWQYNHMITKHPPNPNQESPITIQLNSISKPPTHRDHKSQPIPWLPIKPITDDRRESHPIKVKEIAVTNNQMTTRESHQHRQPELPTTQNKSTITITPNEQPSRTWLKVTTKTNELAKNEHEKPTRKQRLKHISNRE